MAVFCSTAPPVSETENSPSTSTSRPSLPASLWGTLPTNPYGPPEVTVIIFDLICLARAVVHLFSVQGIKWHHARICFLNVGPGCGGVHGTLQGPVSSSAGPGEERLLLRPQAAVAKVWGNVKKQSSASSPNVCRGEAGELIMTWWATKSRMLQTGAVVGADEWIVLVTYIVGRKYIMGNVKKHGLQSQVEMNKSNVFCVFWRI